MTESLVSTSGLLKPGEIIKPMMDKNDVPDIVKKLYDLDVSSVKELKSYDDKNYLVKVDKIPDDHYLDELWPHGYILKILNSMDSKNPELLDGQNQMMLHLHKRDFNVPFPIKSKNGNLMEKETILKKDGEVLDGPAVTNEHMIRLLTFVPGKTLFDVPYTPQLFYECGVSIANLENELKDFYHETIYKRKFIWMLSSTPELSKFLYAVKDSDKNALIQQVLTSWQERVEPISSSFDHGIVHGDFNEQNILVDSDDQDVYHVTGVIDFGDISRSAYVYEVAICIMYLMIEVKSIPAIEVGGHVLAGYYTKRSLSNVEWDVLKVCVAARFAQSLVMGAYSYEQDPGNEYLLTTATKGWKVLSDFWQTPENEILSKWKATMDTYKS